MNRYVVYCDRDCEKEEYPRLGEGKKGEFIHKKKMEKRYGIFCRGKQNRSRRGIRGMETVEY